MLITSLIRRLPLGNHLLRRLRLWQSAAQTLHSLGLSPWKRNVVFDIGANNGSNFADIAYAIPWQKVYAFEPTPQLIEELQQRTHRLENYQIVPKAVGETDGTVKFNVAGQGDWGCSSVLEFSDGLDATWPGRSDFKVTETINVDMIRLDTFLKTESISRIDFLHIDTQGTDLSVLKSLGKEIKKVSGGVIEVPQNDSVKLYKGQHNREQAINWLETQGFFIWKITHQQNEDNLYFRRRGS